MKFNFKKLFLVLVVLVGVIYSVPQAFAETKTEESLIDFVDIDFSDAVIGIDWKYFYPDEKDYNEGYIFPRATFDMDVSVYLMDNDDSLEIFINDELYEESSYYHLEQYLDYYEVEIIVTDDTTGKKDTCTLKLARDANFRSSAINGIWWTISDDKGNDFYPSRLKIDGKNETFSIPVSSTSLSLSFYTEEYDTFVYSVDAYGGLTYLQYERLELDTPNKTTIIKIRSTVDGQDSDYTLTFEKEAELNSNTLIKDISVTYYEDEEYDEYEEYWGTSVSDIKVEEGLYDYEKIIPTEAEELYLYTSGLATTTIVEYIIDGEKEEWGDLEDLEDETDIVLLVTAENGDTQEYNIHIIKSDDLPTELVYVEGEKPGLIDYIIWGSIGFGTATLIFTVVLLIKRKKKKSALVNNELKKEIKKNV